jgi:sugar phosphate isomerase/epimerase
MLGSSLFSSLSSGSTGKKIIPDKNKVMVGAHPWIYAARLPRYDITPKLETIFQDMKYAHFDGVELMHHPLRDPGQVNVIKDLIDKYALPVIGTSYGADMWDRREHPSILKEVATIIKNLSLVDGRTMGISVGNAGKIKTDDQLDAQVELLIKIRQMARDRDIVINLHNHTYEVENEMHDLKGTLQRLPDIALGPDINWLVRGGVDPVQFIHDFGSQIVFMHLRDQHQDGTWSEALGEGDTDFKAISKALQKIEFEGDLVIELAHESGFKPTRPVRESLLISREYVKKIMGY